jgi:hypothetical protein
MVHQCCRGESSRVVACGHYQAESVGTPRAAGEAPRPNGRFCLGSPACTRQQRVMRGLQPWRIWRVTGPRLLPPGVIAANHLSDHFWWSTEQLTQASEVVVLRGDDKSIFSCKRPNLFVAFSHTSLYPALTFVRSDNGPIFIACCSLNACCQSSRRSCGSRGAAVDSDYSVDTIHQRTDRGDLRDGRHHAGGVPAEPGIPRDFWCGLGTRRSRRQSAGSCCGDPAPAQPPLRPARCSHQGPYRSAAGAEAGSAGGSAAGFQWLRGPGCLDGRPPLSRLASAGVALSDDLC